MLRVAITLALAAGLGACGPSSDEAAPGTNTSSAPANEAAASTDPCSLVTPDEVGEVIGDKIVATKPGEGSCTYETADAQASSLTIELNQTDAAGEMDVAKQAAGVLKDMGEQAATEGAAGQDVNAMLSDSGETPKVGDEAFFGANAELSVRKGTSYIAVSPPMMRSRMSGGNPLLSSDEKKKIALQIAEKAVGRLP